MFHFLGDFSPSFVPARSMRGAMVAAAAFALAALMAPAQASALETRTLLVSDRFTPSAAPASSPYSTELWALRGESEGVQVAVLGGGSTLQVGLSQGSDQVLHRAVQLFEVGFVNVAKASTAVSLGAGTYADPLPPLRRTGLPTAAGKWAGVLVRFDIAADVAPGTYAGTVEFSDGKSVVASVPLTVRVSSVVPLARTDSRAFQALVGVTSRYPNQHLIPWKGDDQRTELLANLGSFLAEYRMIPTGFGPYASPNAAGHYDAATAAELAQYQALPYATTPLPMVVSGMNVPKQFRSPKVARYLRAVSAFWRQQGYMSRRPIAWLWDEPGPSSEQGPIPKLARLVHATVPGARTMLTSTPHEKTATRRLRTNFGARRLVTFPGEKYSNANLWNGGSDDADIWNIPTHRYYGRYTSPLEAANGFDNSYVTWKLIQKLRAKGREIWSYSYFIATKYIPQRAIDGPPTDSRLLFQWQAMENNRGWLLWDVARWTKAPLKAKAWRNAYEDTASFRIRAGGPMVNGEASIVYPGYAPQYGLINPIGPPVASLRIEGMRDGIEDVDLTTLYRARFGDAAARKAWGAIFKKARTIPGGGTAWPAYSNSGLATRQEAVRRAMIAKLEVGLPAVPGVQPPPPPSTVT